MAVRLGEDRKLPLSGIKYFFFLTSSPVLITILTEIFGLSRQRVALIALPNVGLFRLKCVGMCAEAQLIAGMGTFLLVIAYYPCGPKRCFMSLVKCILLNTDLS